MIFSQSLIHPYFFTKFPVLTHCELLKSRFEKKTFPISVFLLPTNFNGQIFKINLCIFEYTVHVLRYKFDLKQTFHQLLLFLSVS